MRIDLGIIGLGVKIFDLIWDKLIYPKAKEIVESTENKFDDTALEFLDKLIDELKKL